MVWLDFIYLIHSDLFNIEVNVKQRVLEISTCWFILYFMHWLVSDELLFVVWSVWLLGWPALVSPNAQYLNQWFSFHKKWARDFSRPICSKLNMNTNNTQRSAPSDIIIVCLIVARPEWWAHCAPAHWQSAGHNVLYCETVNHSMVTRSPTSTNWLVVVLVKFQLSVIIRNASILLLWSVSEQSSGVELHGLRKWC